MSGACSLGDTVICRNLMSLHSCLRLIHGSLCYTIIAACASLTLVAGAAELSPDYEREQRLIEEAEAGLFDGEVIYFSAAGRDIFALLSQPEVPSIDGIVMLLHGRGFNPDWPQVIGPLREGFSDLGIPTFSVQMPVLAKDAKYYDYLQIIPASLPRIQGALDYLRSLGYSSITVVAHSCSVHMTMGWFKEFGDAQINAYAGIGMGATDYRQPMLEPFPLVQFKVPILDLFGSEDYPAVVNAAPDRMAAIRQAGHLQSTQITIDGADHFFAGYEEELVDAIAEWLISLN